MENKIIKENKDNDLKYRNGLINNNNDNNFDDCEFNTESNHNQEKLEYFTE